MSHYLSIKRGLTYGNEGSFRIIFYLLALSSLLFLQTSAFPKEKCKSEKQWVFSCSCCLFHFPLGITMYSPFSPYNAYALLRSGQYVFSVIYILILIATFAGTSGALILTWEQKNLDFCFFDCRSDISGSIQVLDLWLLITMAVFWSLAFNRSISVFFLFGRDWEMS